MHQVIAIVRPFAAEEIVKSIQVLEGIDAIQVVEVKGYGRQKSYLDRYSQGEFSLAFLPKMEITIWVDDDTSCERVIQSISKIARSGRMGDGKVMVLPVVSGWDANPMSPS